MSIGQTFPDVIVQPNGTLKLVTIWAKSWMTSNRGWVPGLLDGDDLSWVRNPVSEDDHIARDVPDVIHPKDTNYLVHYMWWDGLTIRPEPSAEVLDQMRYW